MVFEIGDIRRANFNKIAEEKYESNIDIARKLVTSPGYVSQLRIGRRTIGEKAARKIEQALDLPRLWLDKSENNNTKIHDDEFTSRGIIEWKTPDDLPDDTYVLVSRVLLKLKTGDGQLITENQHGTPVAFTTEWIKSKNVNKADLICAKCNDDSMEPTLRKHTLVMLNTAQVKLVDDKIYAIMYNHELRIKRLFNRFDGGMTIRSDNRDKYPDEQLSPEEIKEHVYIIGQIIWQASDV